MGLAYLAGSLRNLCEVECFDLSIEGYNHVSMNKTSHMKEYGLPPEKFKTRIEQGNPDVVGISCLFSSQIQDSIALCKIAKSVNPQIYTVIGGVHPSFLARSLMEKHQEIDFILLSESDDSFPELIKNISQPELIDGLAYKRNQDVVINPKSRFIQNLDQLPFPARDLFPIEKYFEINRPMSTSHNLFYPYHRRNLSLITSRGCPYSCVTCSSSHYWGYQYRFRSVQNVIEELIFLKEKYRIEEIQFIDDNLTANKNRAKSLFKAMIDLKLNLKWTVPNGIQINTLDDEMLELMKESGCYEVFLPVESGSQEVLDQIIRKPLNLKTLTPIVRKVKSLGMRTIGFFIIGFPSETKEQIQTTLSFAKGIGIDIPLMFCATPLIGSPLQKVYEEKEHASSEALSLKGDYFFSNSKLNELNSSSINKLLSSHYRWLLMKTFFTSPLCFLIFFMRIFPCYFKYMINRFYAFFSPKKD